MINANSLLRDGLRRVLTNDWFIVVLLFLLAAVVRWLFVLYNPRPDGFLIYDGKPISDAWFYTAKAISAAEGHGLAVGRQPAIRALYPITLACFYTWFGFSLWAVTVLNIVIAGFTAVLIYLCGARGLNRFCGLGAALFFSIDLSQLLQTPQAATEPLGLLFFLAATYSALRAFETHRPILFLLTGALIGLSNLTRTLTIFTLPFYMALILLLGIRKRAFRGASAYAMVLVLGFAIVTLPWVIRQERLYHISTISDNIGEALYAATSAKYGRWTPRVQQDAQADGIPNNVADRYRYFMDRAADNLKREPGFYISNLGNSLWEYANTFNLTSRRASRYAEHFSRAIESQRVLFIFLLLFVLVSWLLRNEQPYTLSNSLYAVASLGFVLVFRVLPAWLAFLPIGIGLISSSRAGRSLAAYILFGSLGMAVLGSAMFANPTLFRSILMTDWLFLLYLLAALWFPAQALGERLTGPHENVWATRAWEMETSTDFQRTLSLFSRGTVALVCVAVLAFFVISSARLIALTISNPPRPKERHLLETEKELVLHRLQQPPFGLVRKSPGELRIYDPWKRGSTPQPGEYVVALQQFAYGYYIPAWKSPPRDVSDLRARPYPRTLIVLSPFDFSISGEVPSGFSSQPTILVGVLTATPLMGHEPRLQVEGLAIIPLDEHKQPDFPRAFCSPPSWGGE